jgi:hypothetical protein
MESYYSTIALFLAIALFFGGVTIWNRIKPPKPEAEAGNNPSPPLPADAPGPAEPQVTRVEDLFDGPGEDVWGGDGTPSRGGPEPMYHTYRPDSTGRDDWR